MNQLDMFKVIKDVWLLDEEEDVLASMEIPSHEAEATSEKNEGSHGKDDWRVKEEGH